MHRYWPPALRRDAKEQRDGTTQDQGNKERHEKLSKRVTPNKALHIYIYIHIYIYTRELSTHGSSHKRIKHAIPGTLRRGESQGGGVHQAGYVDAWANGAKQQRRTGHDHPPTPPGPAGCEIYFDEPFFPLLFLCFSIFGIRFDWL